jgi:hypothetical protein
MKVQPDPDYDGDWPLALGAASAAHQTEVIGTKAPGAAAAKSILTGGCYNLAALTLADGEQAATQLDSRGILKITGGVANAATDSGAPVKVGGVYRLTQTTLTDGQRGDVAMTTRGEIGAAMVGLSAAAADGISNTLNYTAASGGLNSPGRALAVAGGVFNGSTWDRMRGDVNGLIVQADAPAASRWAYAAGSAGIVNSAAAVTFIAAAGAGVRNYCKSAEITAEALGAATEIAIRDGAGGTVLWRSKIGTAGWPNGRNIRFDPPLRGTANTLMEIVTLSASVTGAVYANLQGYQAT